MSLYNVEFPLVYESMLLIYLAATLHVLALFATGNVVGNHCFGQLYLQKHYIVFPQNIRFHQCLGYGIFCQLPTCRSLEEHHVRLSIQCNINLYSICMYIYALIINYVPNVDISLISASSFIANQLSQDPWTLEPNKSNDLRKCPERCADPTINILFQDLQYLCHGSTGGCNRDTNCVCIDLTAKSTTTTSPILICLNHNFRKKKNVLFSV